jgi:purine nucleoside phosphorylase
VSRSDKDVGKRGVLSGMRGVILGAGLGAFAATKGAQLAQKAMTNYVMSRATGAPGQAAGGTPPG